MFSKITNYIKRKTREFLAGSYGTRIRNWRPKDTYARYIAKDHLRLIIARSRDLVNNNPLAKSAMRILCNNVIRDGIQPKFKKQNRKTEHFCKWLKDNNVEEMQHLIMKTIFQSGSVLIRRIKKRTKNSNVPLSLQILEPEWIDLDKHQMFTETGNRVISGKEFTQDDKLVAYYLHENHPQNTLDYSYKTIRVPADEILHIFEVDRPDQIHGMPILTNCTYRLHQFDGYQDAKLEQQRVSACFAIFTKGISDVHLGLGDPEGSADYDVDKITPGMIAHLGTNDVVVANPPNANEGDAYAKSVIREIATSIGITYEQLTGDYSQVNFSSAKMARIEFRANVRRWQNIITRQFLDEIYKWYAEVSLISGIQAEESIKWVGASVPAVDTEQQAKAYRELIRNGLMSQSDALQELGYEPEQFYEKLAEDNATLDRLKIILDTDPRNTARGGTLNTEMATEGNLSNDDTAN